MEYLEEAYSPPNAPEGQHALILPPLSDPYGRARAKLEADKINRALVPAFYRFLQAQVCCSSDWGELILDTCSDNRRPPSKSSSGRNSLMN